MIDWTDLGDDELEVRLIQRGLPRDDARSWTDYRETPSGMRQISIFLADEPPND